jgi:hypothetical protein
MLIGRLVDIGNTALHPVERGSGPSVMALGGGPELNHQAFADYHGDINGGPDLGGYSG